MFRLTAFEVSEFERIIFDATSPPDEYGNVPEPQNTILE